MLSSYPCHFFDLSLIQLKDVIERAAIPVGTLACQMPFLARLRDSGFNTRLQVGPIFLGGPAGYLGCGLGQGDVNALI